MNVGGATSSGRDQNDLVQVRKKLNKQNFENIINLQILLKCKIIISLTVNYFLLVLDVCII